MYHHVSSVHSHHALPHSVGAASITGQFSVLLNAYGLLFAKVDGSVAFETMFGQTYGYFFNNVTIPGWGVYTSQGNEGSAYDAMLAVINAVKLLRSSQPVTGKNINKHLGQVCFIALSPCIIDSCMLLSVTRRFPLSAPTKSLASSSRLTRMATLSTLDVSSASMIRIGSTTKVPSTPRSSRSNEGQYAPSAYCHLMSCSDACMSTLL